MENFKFIVFSIIVLGFLGVLGVWAFSSLESGSSHVNKQREKELVDENRTLAEEVRKLKAELLALQPAPEESVEETGEIAGEEVATPTPAQPTPPADNASYKHQTLIGELETLAKDNIQMKSGSRGTRVGTIQKFLNVYNNTSKRVDNDYGKTTTADVTAFQKAEGISADGETGPATYRKMVEWLKEQG